MPGKPIFLFGFVIAWFRGSRTDLIWAHRKQHCGHEQTHVLEHALHTSRKAEQQGRRAEAFLALVGIGFGG